MPHRVVLDWLEIIFQHDAAAAAAAAANAIFRVRDLCLHFNCCAFPPLPPLPLPVPTPALRLGRNFCIFLLAHFSVFLVFSRERERELILAAGIAPGAP